MKKILIVLCFFAANAKTQQITWQRYFGNVALGNSGYGILQEPDSGFVIAANIFSSNSITLIRTDKNGDTLFSKKIYGFDPRKIIKTLDSGYAVVAKIPALTGVLLLKLNSACDTLWSKQYNPGTLTGGYDLCQTEDSGYVIATQGSFFKVDKNGSFMWSVYMGYCNAVKEAPNGDIIATGSTCNGPDYYTVDRVSSTGQLIWNRTYGNISNNSDWWSVSDFILLPDSNILAVCQYKPGGWHLMKINYATGDTMFTNLVPVPGLNYINSIAPLIDGNLALGMDYYLLKADTQGNTIWSKGMTFSINEITGCSDGGIGITGLYYPSPPNSVVTYAKTDSLGNIYNFQGINNLYGKGENWVYPNPVTTTATLQFKNEQQQKVTLTVYDVLGNAIIIKQTTGNRFIINAAQLKRGMYFYNFNTGNVLYNGKFVVE